MCSRGEGAPSGRRAVCFYDGGRVCFAGGAKQTRIATTTPNSVSEKTFFFISEREFRPDEVVGRNVLASFSAEPE